MKRPRSTDHVARFVLYAIGEPEFVKLGYAENLKSRLSGVQSGNPRALRVLATKHFVGLGKVRAAEIELHTRFHHLRVRGEWFRLDEELACFLASVWWHHPMRRLDRASERFRSVASACRSRLLVERPDLSPEALDDEAFGFAMQEVGLA